LKVIYKNQHFGLLHFKSPTVVVQYQLHRTYSTGFHKQSLLNKTFFGSGTDVATHLVLFF